MAHIVGYVGRTDENDIEQYGPGQALFTHTGRSGVERYYDKALRGEVGYEEVKTNVEGRALGRVGRIPATAGADLRLAVDVDLQRTMVEARSEEHTSELQSLMRISYAVFCLKKKRKKYITKSKKKNDKLNKNVGEKIKRTQLDSE